ncbi:pantoate-beta-alanine ligase [Schizosaccharomyces japonicus yFS275]|uniref:Pantoate--beta-alanine ligase n=1 Tax=Schizosaccharomyces japonicus (strain yFS275 / FY16936) TaxID=402676 RepID=B6K4W5_SCHJY|nr:pantoate-beta-alanine ligase [Schizosaccharomyces japonicus yFS275]EEB08522.1 pantoate-beta-alanine ligase [Schizosaccharomyces japonicus yFS275]
MSSPKVFQKVDEFRNWRNELYKHGKVIGFVPTMGALHDGHMSLIEQAMKDSDVVVVSIFVNPSQFGPTEDLDKYPRTLDSDLEKIRELQKRTNRAVDAVLCPTVTEMYPSGYNPASTTHTGAFVTVKGFSHQLEGQFRPTFFRGVATVVTKLLHIVHPAKLYLGQKDFQQTVVLRRMVKDLLMDTQVIICPIVREQDGLALSSRNVYLSEKERTEATALYRSLTSAKALVKPGTKRATIIQHVEDFLKKELPACTIDYVSVANIDNLHELDAYQEPGKYVLNAVIRLGTTRLLDNIIL